MTTVRCTMTQHQLLNHQTGLDSLPEAHVIKAMSRFTARHLERSSDRVELIVLERGTASEGCVERQPISRCDGTPADGVEKRLESLGIVESLARVRQGRSFEHMAPGFELPYDLEILALPVVLDRAQRNEMLRVRHARAQSVRITRELALLDVVYDIPPLADGH